MRIRLLGPPAVEHDGRPARAPRGRKAWALLAYVLLAQRPPSRQHLAELFFQDADDPRGALRWTLAELRRALEAPAILGGDPVSADLGTIDTDLDRLEDADGELLEGVNLDSCLEFESWLLVERHRVSAAVEARLRERAVSLLAAGRPAEAIPYAARAVARNRFEEGNHILLARGLAMSGDRAAALRQIAICEDTLRPLGVQASPALREAGESTRAITLPLGGRAAATSQLEAGRAAIVAGAVEAGLQCLRRAVVEAERCHDPALHAKTMAALGSALVHAARGRDEEGSVVLAAAIAAAAEAGERAVSVVAHRELGFVEVQAGRRVTANAWLTRAQALAETDEEMAAILGVQGMNASDLGDYPGAFAFLEESVQRARAADDDRQRAWSLSLQARAHLLRGERSQAESRIGESLELVQSQRWMAFLPWPQALRAELDLLDGDLDQAAEGFERAWALGCQLDDPCWEGMAARGLGLLHAGRGDHTTASTWLGEAAARASRVSDRYQWVHGYVLDAAVVTALARRNHVAARTASTELMALAARCDMREFVVRAHLHQHHLGDRSALGAAQKGAAGIDNPALARLVGEAT